MLTCGRMGSRDPLLYSFSAPSGEIEARGQIEAGKSQTLDFTPPADGVYVLDANPGMNAFIVKVQGGDLLVTVTLSPSDKTVIEVRQEPLTASWVRWCRPSRPGGGVDAGQHENETGGASDA